MSRWKIYLRAVIWKEFLEVWRKSKLFFLITVVFALVMMYVPVSQIINNNNIADIQKQAFLGVLTIYLSPMVIPFLGGTILTRSLHEEKLQCSIHVLLASGVSHTIIWIGKFLVSVVFSYLTALLSLMVYYGLITLIFGLSPAFNWSLLLMAVFAMPVATFGILAILGWACWGLKNPQIAALIVPLFFTIGTWNLSIQFGTKQPLPTIAIFVIMAGVSLIIMSILGVNRISKERIISI